MAYSLGHSPQELERLTFQASILKPVTERLIRETGAGRHLQTGALLCMGRRIR
jgi:hypothetical protein